MIQPVNAAEIPLLMGLPIIPYTDWVIQRLGLHESGRWTHLVTGAVLGVAVSYYVFSMWTKLFNIPLMLIGGAYMLVALLLIQKEKLAVHSSLN